MSQEIIIVIRAEIPEGATMGECYGNAPLTRQETTDYLRNAYLGADNVASVDLVPGLDIQDITVSGPTYVAHDSGFMAFAVETDGYGTYHAVDPDGTEIARTDQVNTHSGETTDADVRKAWHQLVDKVADLPQD